MPYDDLDERGLPARIASWTYGIVLGLLFGWPFGHLVGADGPWLVAFVIVSMFVAGYTIKRILTVVPEGMAKAFLYLIWPSGQSTPYAPTYSNEQALAARGDIAGALEAYDEAIRLRPMDPEPAGTGRALDIQADRLRRDGQEHEAGAMGKIKFGAGEKERFAALAAMQKDVLRGAMHIAAKYGA